MKKIEKVFLYSILGVIPPLTGFLAGWFFTSQVQTVWKVILVAVCGGLLGIVVDVLFLKRWLHKAYQADLKIWVVILIFFSICVFGFFMGVPVFNLVLAIPAGFFIACRQADQADIGRDQCLFFWTKMITTSVFALICLSSAILALRDPYTAANLEGMFRLNFELTQPMIVGLVLVGGMAVLALNWWLTAKTIQITTSWKEK